MLQTIRDERINVRNLIGALALLDFSDGNLRGFEVEQAAQLFDNLIVAVAAHDGLANGLLLGVEKRDSVRSDAKVSDVACHD
jgi:hypothetical protein